MSPDDLLIDCHSFPSEMNRNIDICIGFNEDRTKPSQSTIEYIYSTFERVGYRVGVNEPYSNSISPNCRFAYQSIMIEVNKQVYMDEKTLELMPKRQILKNCLSEIYATLIDNRLTL